VARGLPRQAGRGLELEGVELLAPFVGEQRLAEVQLHALVADFVHELLSGEGPLGAASGGRQRRRGGGAGYVSHRPGPHRVIGRLAYSRRMCAQCWATAATAATGATGLRAWAAARRPGWLTPPRLKRLSAALLVLAVCASSLRV
jgi:hypothetical protein